MRRSSRSYHVVHLGPQRSLRYGALRDAAFWLALAAGAVLILLLLTGAPPAVQALGWVAFVGDLLVLRITSHRLAPPPEWGPDEGERHAVLSDV